MIYSDIIRRRIDYLELLKKSPDSRELNGDLDARLEELNLLLSEFENIRGDTETISSSDFGYYYGITTRTRTATRGMEK